ncbi:hypothetical protein [Micromonospora sp. LH3U1]|uniref:hypothetical protein n=1 Tax=Micromonospora sp. LH3U1 TaxID=3018339 RepID=UPI00234BB501|nr:hypothetical protein [Micromonospora sp. LH3U1]WCN84849.1 hypothetical protein PCA76_03680 [Micromonospora sp. LH3U1]
MRRTGQDAELAAGALPPLDPPDEDDPEEDDPEEDDDPEDDESDDEEEEPDDEDDEDPSPEDDSDFAGLLAAPPAVASEPDARESVR